MSWVRDEVHCTAAINKARVSFIAKCDSRGPSRCVDDSYGYRIERSMLQGVILGPLVTEFIGGKRVYPSYEQNCNFRFIFEECRNEKN